MLIRHDPNRLAVTFESRYRNGRCAPPAVPGRRVLLDLPA
jgi:hypothetical protein